MKFTDILLRGVALNFILLGLFIIYLGIDSLNYPV